MRLGTPFGIEVYVHWTFSILLVWIMGNALMAGQGVFGALSAGIFVVAVFACVTLHELGHIVASEKNGLLVRTESTPEDQVQQDRASAEAMFSPYFVREGRGEILADFYTRALLGADAYRLYMLKYQEKLLL